MDNMGDDTHILIEGDNFHALTTLNMMCGNEGFVDVIYIDPPYNRGEDDFIYNDNYVDKEDGYKHSKWLTFMERRLLLARNILKENGAIFISIDDNEQAQLKLLCDSIFSNSNFMGTIIQNKLNAKNDSTDIQKNHEYIHSYRKKTVYESGTKVKPTLINKRKVLRKVEEEEGRYYYIGDAITTRGEGGTLNARPNLGYTVYYNDDTKDKIGVCDYDVDRARTANNESEIYSDDNDLIARGYEPIRPPKVRGKLGCWTWSLEKFNSQNDEIIITARAGKRAVKKRTFVPTESIEENDGKLYYASIESGNSKSVIEYSTNDGTNVHNAVMGVSGTFNNPKNLEMIKYLISLIDNPNATVLDFFAGSGTTMQVVLELNSEDEGTRKCIICTNNENGICTSVTLPRIKTVMTGKRSDGSVYSEGMPANLMYYKTEFIHDSRDTDQAKYCLVEKVDELLCIIEETYVAKERTDFFSHYETLSGDKHTFIYSEYYNDVQFADFVEHINAVDGEKIVYMFSTDNNVDG